MRQKRSQQLQDESKTPPPPLVEMYTVTRPLFNALVQHRQNVTDFPRTQTTSCILDLILSHKAISANITHRFSFFDLTSSSPGSQDTLLFQRPTAYSNAVTTLLNTMSLSARNVGCV